MADTATASSGEPLAPTMGPVQLVMYRRLRTIQKRLQKIENAEKKRADGGEIDEQQEELIAGKPQTLIMLDEFTRLTEQVTAAVHEERAAAVAEHKQKEAAKAEKMAAKRAAREPPREPPANPPANPPPPPRRPRAAKRPRAARNPAEDAADAADAPKNPPNPLRIPPRTLPPSRAEARLTRPSRWRRRRVASSPCCTSRASSTSPFPTCLPSATRSNAARRSRITAIPRDR